MCTQLAKPGLQQRIAINQIMQMLVATPTVPPTQACRQVALTLRLGIASSWSPGQVPMWALAGPILTPTACARLRRPGPLIKNLISPIASTLDYNYSLNFAASRPNWSAPSCVAPWPPEYGLQSPLSARPTALRLRQFVRHPLNSHDVWARMGNLGRLGPTPTAAIGLGLENASEATSRAKSRATSRWHAQNSVLRLCLLSWLQLTCCGELRKLCFKPAPIPAPHAERRDQ